jgi:SAM-dependent methyltransferase
MAEPFANACAYDAAMGRWSARLAPAFLEFARLRDGGRVLDVGCGTGSLAGAIAASAPGAEIVGIDPALPFVQYARTRLAAPRITFDHGSALDLPYPAGAFDHTLALLVLMFIPQFEQAAREMRRVTRPGGTVAACSWAAGGLEMGAVLWEEAGRLDPESVARAERPLRLDQPGQLEELWRATGLAQVEESVLEMRMDFTSFDDYWQPFLQGAGPSGVYVAGLSPERREGLRRALETRLQGNGPSSGFSLRATALAVRGVVPCTQ